jgi:hypothetical protein
MNISRLSQTRGRWKHENRCRFAGDYRSIIVSTVNSSESVALHMGDQRDKDSRSAVFGGVDNVEDSIRSFLEVHRLDCFSLLVPIRRLFYEGQVTHSSKYTSIFYLFAVQMIYLERMMRSAEVKYIGAAALAKSIYSSLNSSETRYSELIEYLQYVICSSLINAASCRASHASKSRVLLPDVSSFVESGEPFPFSQVTIEELCDMDAGGLAVLAYRCYIYMTTASAELVEIQFNRCVILIKLALVEEKLGRYLFLMFYECRNEY